MIYNVGTGGGATSADKIDYDNTDSGLEATNVQDGIDELNSNLGDVSEITTQTYPSVVSYIQYCITEGILPDLNSVALIPNMTSNTTPRGIAKTDCSYSSAHGQWPTSFDGGNNAYKAFDGVDNFEGLTEYTDDNVKKYVEYDFVSNVILKKLEVKYRTSENRTGLYFDYYDVTNNNWVNFYLNTDLRSNGVISSINKILDTPVTTNKIRVRTDGGRSGTRMVICSIQAYCSSI